MELFTLLGILIDESALLRFALNVAQSLKPLQNPSVNFAIVAIKDTEECIKQTSKMNTEHNVDRKFLKTSNDF